MAGKIRSNLPLLCHTYPGITPWNIWDLDAEILDDLIKAAQQTSSD